MKKRLAMVFLVLLAMPFGAAAQASFNLSWGVTGLVQSKIVEVEFDLTFGLEYYALHGAFTSANDLSLPSRGTCFLTSTGGATCTATMGSQSMLLDIEPDLNGTIAIFSPLGDLVERGSMTIKSVQE